MKRIDFQIIGLVSFLNKKYYFTVFYFLYINKKLREQLKLIIHRHILNIVSSLIQIMDILMKLNISSGIDVEIR